MYKEELGKNFPTTNSPTSRFFQLSFSTQWMAFGDWYKSFRKNVLHLAVQNSLATAVFENYRIFLQIFARKVESYQNSIYHVWNCMQKYVWNCVMKIRRISLYRIDYTTYSIRRGRPEFNRNVESTGVYARKFWTIFAVQRSLTRAIPINELNFDLDWF